MLTVSLLMSLLYVLEDVFGVLERLPGMFVTAQVVFFSRVHGGGAGGVRGGIAKFSSSLAGIVHQLVGSPAMEKVSGLSFRIVQGRRYECRTEILES